MSINYLLQIQKVKTRGQISRKATSLTEITTDANKPLLHELFRYDPENGSFEPDNIQDVIKSSKRLRYATQFLGIPDIKADMQKRIGLLDECVKRKAYGINQAFGIISKYYNVENPAS